MRRRSLVLSAFHAGHNGSERTGSTDWVVANNEGSHDGGAGAEAWGAHADRRCGDGDWRGGGVDSHPSRRTERVARRPLAARLEHLRGNCVNGGRPIRIPGAPVRPADAGLSTRGRLALGNVGAALAGYGPATHHLSSRWPALQRAGGRRPELRPGPRCAGRARGGVEHLGARSPRPGGTEQSYTLDQPHGPGPLSRMATAMRLRSGRHRRATMSLPPPRKSLHMIDLSALVVGYSLAALLIRAFW